jgi:hypothetical protein
MLIMSRTDAKAIPLPPPLAPLQADVLEWVLPRHRILVQDLRHPAFTKPTERPRIDKLDAITEDIVRHDTALKSINAAIVEAGERLKAAQAIEQQAQAREVARELLARADAIVEHARALDDANTVRVAEGTARSEELEMMRAPRCRARSSAPHKPRASAFGSDAQVRANRKGTTSHDIP